MECLECLLLVLRDPLHDLLIDTVNQLLVLFLEILNDIAC